MDMSIQQLNESINNLQQENSSLIAIKKQKEEELSRTQAELTRSFEQMNNQSQFSASSQEIESLTRANQDLLREIRGLQDSNNHFSRENEDLKKDNRDLTDRYNRAV